VIQEPLHFILPVVVLLLFAVFRRQLFGTGGPAAAAPAQGLAEPLRQSRPVQPLPITRILHRIDSQSRKWQTPVQVRPMEPGDAADLAALYVLLEERDAIPKGGREHFRSWLDGREGTCLVAATNGKAAGICGFHSMPINSPGGCCYITYLLIHPDCQRMGLGSLLVAAALTIVDSPGAWMLIALQTIRQSRSFWTGMGATEWQEWVDKDGVRYWSYFAGWHPGEKWRIASRLEGLISPAVHRLSVWCEPSAPEAPAVAAAA